MDLFLPWLLSNPLLEPKPQPEAGQTGHSELGDTAPHVLTGWQSPSELSNARLWESLESDYPKTSMEAISAKG